MECPACEHARKYRLGQNVILISGSIVGPCRQLQPLQDVQEQLFGEVPMVGHGCEEIRNSRCRELGNIHVDIPRLLWKKCSVMALPVMPWSLIWGRV